MARLLHLPSELLGYVFDELTNLCDYDQKQSLRTSLLALCLTSKRIGFFASQRLWRHIDLCIYGQPWHELSNQYSIDNENEHSNTDSMNELDNKSSSLFCQSILGGTASALFVQNVGLSWGTFDADDDYPFSEALRVKTESQTQINRVLAKLPNIQRLLLSDYYFPMFNPFKPDFISNADPSNFRGLSHVTIHHLSYPDEALATSTDVLCMYLLLPALEVLETQYTKVTTPTDYDHQPRGPRPALSRLSLGAGHLPASVVHSLLLRTAAVKLLQCVMPGTKKEVFETHNG